MTKEGHNITHAILDEPVAMLFPILILSEKNNMCYVFKDEYKFSITSLDIFKRKKIKKNTIYDSNGYIHDTYDIEMIGWGAPLWGYFTMKKGRAIQIRRLYTTRADKIDLDDFKKLVLSKVLNSKGMARHMYISKMPIEDFELLIMGSTDYKDIIRTVS